MSVTPQAYLSMIQIRYRIRYITWLRTRAWAQANNSGMSETVDRLLGEALDHLGVASDPNELMRLTDPSRA